MKKMHNKLWLCATLSAVALTLSACGKKDDAPMQTEPTVDTQTAVEDNATGVATANNTVAIVMANPIAKEMAQEYGITPQKTASLLDTFSCIFQGIIPYGAQMLVAISAVNELGGEISAFQIIPYLFYPFLLLISTLAFIFIVPEKKG